VFVKGYVQSSYAAFVDWPYKHTARMFETSLPVRPAASLGRKLLSSAPTQMAFKSSQIAQ